MDLSGDVSDGESFDVQALVDSDETGLLAVAGMNTLFSGSDASDIAVRQELIENPGLLASATNPDGTGNGIIQRLSELAEKDISALGGVSLQEHYHKLVSSVGSQTVVREMRKDSLGDILEQLKAQSDEAGGVDPNMEVAKLIIFERMFQSMSKVIATQNKILGTLMDLL